MADGRRAKYLTMLAVVAASGLALLGSTQTWYTLHLAAAASHDAAVTVQGSVASSALTALSLAGLALTAALAIAGRIARVVLAVLGIVLGACILLAVISTMADPVAAGSAQVTTATGISGPASIARLVASVDTSIWPWFGVAGGAILLLASASVFVTGRRWPGASRRYQAVRFDTAAETAEAADPAEAADRPETSASGTEAGEPRPETASDAAVDKWDELTRGEDPTR